MREKKSVSGSWDEKENAWVSETLKLTGDGWLDVELDGKGRLVIKKAEEESGPWPMALISPWTGPCFKIRLYGTTVSRYIRIYLTQEPKNIYYANI